MNNILLQVGYNRSDVGVTYLGITSARHSVVDYSFPLLPAEHKWMCQAPGPVPPYLNLIKTFDLPSWIIILVSLAIVGITLLIITRKVELLDYNKQNQVKLYLSTE